MAKRTRKAAKAVTRKNPATSVGARAALERMGEQAMTTASRTARRAKAKAKKAVKTLKTSKKAQAAAAAAGIAVAAVAAGLMVRRARNKK
jgi:hypothetical protein